MTDPERPGASLPAALLTAAVDTRPEPDPNPEPAPEPKPEPSPEPAPEPDGREPALGSPLVSSPSLLRNPDFARLWTARPSASSGRR